MSVLSCFSKILENMMYNSLYSYLDQNNILYNEQFGFRGGQSIDHPLTELIDIFIIPLTKKIIVVAFIDLPKVFDTVDSEILFKNFSYMMCKEIYLNNLSIKSKFKI